MSNFTHPPIKGVLPQQFLPEKWGLVLEGGGSRGCFTAGVLDSFLHKKLMFPYIVGISAGAANGLSYVSCQEGRNRQMFRHYVPLKKYMGPRHFFCKKTFLNHKYVFEEIPNRHLFFDWEVFNQNPANFLSGAFDNETGSMHWFRKDTVDENYWPIKAATAIPFLSPEVEFQEKKLLDGGITTPIPIEKSVKDGNSFHVIVLTRQEGYEKKPCSLPLSKLNPCRYERVLDCLTVRHEIYNKQVELCETLEKQGKALILRPKNRVTVGKLERNPEKLMDLYQDGWAEAEKYGDFLLQHLVDCKENSAHFAS